MIIFLLFVAKVTDVKEEFDVKDELKKEAMEQIIAGNLNIY